MENHLDIKKISEIEFVLPIVFDGSKDRLFKQLKNRALNILDEICDLIGAESELERATTYNLIEESLIRLTDSQMYEGKRKNYKANLTAETVLVSHVLSVLNEFEELFNQGLQFGSRNSEDIPIENVTQHNNSEKVKEDISHKVGVVFDFMVKLSELSSKIDVDPKYQVASSYLYHLMFENICRVNNFNPEQTNIWNLATRKTLTMLEGFSKLNSFGNFVIVGDITLFKFPLHISLKNIFDDVPENQFIDHVLLRKDGEPMFTVKGPPGWHQNVILQLFRPSAELSGIETTELSRNIIFEQYYNDYPDHGIIQISDDFEDDINVAAIKVTKGSINKVNHILDQEEHLLDIWKSIFNFKKENLRDQEMCFNYFGQIMGNLLVFAKAIIQAENILNETDKDGSSRVYPRLDPKTRLGFDVARIMMNVTGAKKIKRQNFLQIIQLLYTSRYIKEDDLEDSVPEEFYRDSFYIFSYNQINYFIKQKEAEHAGEPVPQYKNTEFVIPRVFVNVPKKVGVCRYVNDASPNDGNLWVTVNPILANGAPKNIASKKNVSGKKKKD